MAPQLPKVVRTVFIALLIDIFSFTVILPLFPRLLDYYRVNEAQDPTSLFSQMLLYIQGFKAMIGGSGSRMDVVLFGGALGSLFSMLQCLVSPVIGRLSDKYGRKRVLMIAMTGNLLSCFLWIVSKQFWVFVLSRVVGGLSEGNVQLSVSIITDVTTPETRSRGLAYVGIAFALGFTFGPALGAYFSTMNLGAYSAKLASYGLNPYSASAMLAFGLILVEMVYLHFALDETLPAVRRKMATKTTTTTKSVQSKNASKLLWQLARLHFLYLFVFSGLEFTLPFLTFDRFEFTNAQQGKLLGFVGLLSALLQGGYTRRVAARSKNGERKIVMQGLGSCSLAFMVLALWRTVTGLYVGAALLALTSATVVTGLTSLASLCCAQPGGDGSSSSASDDDDPGSGLQLGKFRSLGQLGRAVGPIMACSLYWLWGPVLTYIAGSMALVGVTLIFRSIRGLPTKAEQAKKKTT
ncbi:hypothetical protein RI367_006576 [Sorochytrium milnesiophthora]